MLTGSLVSSLQGIPRSTHDIDIIISIKNIDTNKLIEAFSRENYYLDKKAIEDWLKLSGGSRKHFNDAVNTFEIQYGGLDMDYISFWAQKLNIESLFEELKIEANTLE